MIVVSKQKLIATIAERWHDTHFGRGCWLHTTPTFDPEAIYSRLKVLTASASEADVIAVTGQPWWTANVCHECALDSQVTVGFGQEPHHPLDVKYLCPSCLEKALNLAR